VPFKRSTIVVGAKKGGKSKKGKGTEIIDEGEDEFEKFVREAEAAAEKKRVAAEKGESMDAESTAVPTENGERERVREHTHKHTYIRALIHFLSFFFLLILQVPTEPHPWLRPPPPPPPPRRRRRRRSRRHHHCPHLLRLLLLLLTLPMK